MLKLIVAVCFLVSVVGCSTEQDPLKGESDDVRLGIPPNTKPKVERPPCRTDSLLLDSVPRVAKFVESEEGKIEFTARALGCGIKDFKIEILNLPENATFETDNEKGTFVWSPPEYTVSGQNLYVQNSLKIRVFSLGDTASYIEREIIYYVSRLTNRQPQVLSAKLVASAVNELSSSNLIIRVKDLDSFDGRVGSEYAPLLNFITIDNFEKNGVPYINMRDWSNPKPDPNDRTIWEYTLSVRPNNNNIVKKDTELMFDVFAISRFGVMSDVFSAKYKVKNRIVKPKISWPAISSFKVEFVKGQKNKYSFWVYDARNEGKVTGAFLNQCSRLHGKATCKCELIGTTRNRDSGSYCTIDWEVPLTYNEDQEVFIIKVENKNFDDRRDIQIDNFRRTIWVKDSLVIPDGGPL